MELSGSLNPVIMKTGISSYASFARLPCICSRFPGYWNNVRGGHRHNSEQSSHFMIPLTTLWQAQGLIPVRHYSALTVQLHGYYSNLTYLIEIKMLLGIDTGGTFTDFFYYDGKSINIHKVLSTPDAPDQAIVRGITDLGLGLHGLRIIHGSTVATNAVLEGKGVRTVYIANRGLKDVLTIGRQARRELYNLQPRPIPPPVPEECCLEINCRLDARGNIVESLTDEDIRALVHQIRQLQPRSVAINLLFSYIDGTFEQQIARSLPKELFVSCSSEVLPVQGEYERGITTWLNAYVGPLVQGYLHHLSDRLAPATLSVMRSSGQTCQVGNAGREAVHLLLSGPAGGLSGVRYIGALCGADRLLTFDMGGTSTDVALIDGAIRLTSQGHIGNFPVAVPMVDMHTIGAGGGSIAYADAGGALQVGPQSAGAQPGPACYNLGGVDPTITDANVVLGRLPRSIRLGGYMPLDYQRAVKSLVTLVEPLALETVEQVAEGIIRVANEHMAQALRLISVQRGIDPRAYVLVAFGGAGGLHLCSLADALGITRAIAPVHAGVLSALGMLVAPPGRQLTKTLGILLSEYLLQNVEQSFSELEDHARSSLLDEGIDVSRLRVSRSVDLCYRGQAFTLNIPWDGAGAAERCFHEQHLVRFGHTLDTPVELVNICLGVVVEINTLALVPMTGDRSPCAPVEYSTAYGVEQAVPVWDREMLPTGHTLSGPAIIFDKVSTLYLEHGWHCHADKWGNLALEKG